MQFKQIICYFAAIMKYQFCISFLLCCAMWFTACTGPVILEEPKEDMTHTEQNNTTQNPNDESLPEDSVSIVHEGTYTSPYSIAEAQVLKRGEKLWIEGYIVGCVSGSMKNGCNYTQEATTTSNILLADTFLMGNEDDYLRCLPVELPNNSIERKELNLQDNPENYHQKIRIQGDITSYYNVTGIKNIATYIFDENEGENENGNENEDQEEKPDTPNEPQEPDETINHEGTYTSPYSIAEAQVLKRGEGLWIEGYIVGCVSGSMKNGCNYTQETTTTSNILLADTFLMGNEDDYLQCLPVELPNNSIEREDLNLYDNPENYHKKIRIQGDITLYYKVTGMKNIVDYIFDEDEDKNENGNENEDQEENPETPSEPQEPNETINPDETSTDTLTIAEGIALQSDWDYNQACIRGYIVGYSKGNKSVVYPDSTAIEKDQVTGNVVLADHIDTKENSMVIIVQLPKGYIRDEVNLYDNPQNLHKRLTVKGRMTTYNGWAGCKETLGAENRERFLLE